MCSAQLQGLALTPKIRDLQSEPVGVRATEVYEGKCNAALGPNGQSMTELESRQCLHFLEIIWATDTHHSHTWHI